ncbi:unnamed protein product, partial [Porites lobata]
HYLDSKWWNGAPVWITNQKAFKKSAVVFWPGSEVKIEGQHPTHYLPLPMIEQDDPPSFLAAHFNEPDHSGHKFSPNSPEIKSVIRRMDNVTGYLLESLRNRGLLNQVRKSNLK